MSEKLLLIDGHSLMFRAFYGMPLNMTGPGGVHTNAVYGFLTILNKVIEAEKPDYLAVAFDLAAPTFRHKLYPDYKGNRGPAPAEFHEQMPLIREVLKSMQIPVLSAEGWEADDLLGTLSAQAEQQGIDAEILSGDRDLLQTVTDHITVILPKTKGGETTYERYDPEAVRSAMGVTPTEFIDVKALMGDTSDNVPGLQGVGPKTAAKIIVQFHSVENAYDHWEEVTPKKAREALYEHYEDVLLSKNLVTIRKDAPVLFERESFRMGELFNEDSYQQFKSLGFKSLLAHFERESRTEQSEQTFTVLENADTAAEVFGRERDLAGVSVLADRDGIYGAAVSDESGTYTYVSKETSDTEVYAKLLRAVLHSTGQIASSDTKRILRLCPDADDTKLFDIVVAAYLINPLKSDWAYDTISADYLTENRPSKEELIGKKGCAAAVKNADHREKFALLAGNDAETAYRSLKPLQTALDENGLTGLFRTVEMPLVPVLAQMENEGILASRAELEKYGAGLTDRIAELEDRIYSSAGEQFNINSPKQLGVILFEKMKLPGGRKTKTGYSTAADVLEKLAPDVPVVSDILEYRMLTKLKSTYADGLPAFIDGDGRIRTTFHQTITATGRLSSTDPNLQNIPMREDLGRMIRKCFYPKPGCVFVDADYSQIELRILAHMSGDQKLIDAYRQAEDIHRITASQVFHVPFEEVSDDLRRKAKAVNFGIVYGISSFGLSQGLSISKAEAAEYIERYFETYPEIKSFLDKLVKDAKEKGYAESLFGRRRPIPELKAANFMQRSFGERVAMNSPIQGTAADVIKLAMIRVKDRLKREGLQSKLILQIHDELLIEAPEEESTRVRELLVEEMRNAASLDVVLEADCHIGRDWYEAK